MIGKRKSGILFLLYLLLSLFLPGCAPYQTYEELETEAQVTGDTTKLDKREALAEKAGDFFAHKRECLAASNMIWFCSNGPESKPSRKPEPGIDDLVKQYGRARTSRCGCATRVQMRDAMKRLMRNQRY